MAIPRSLDSPSSARGGNQYYGNHMIYLEKVLVEGAILRLSMLERVFREWEHGEDWPVMIV